MNTTTAAPDGAVIKTSIESVQGAVASFDKIAAGLAAIEAAHPKDVVVDCTTVAGMRHALFARAAWRDPRIAVEKARKEAKAPVLALGKQIDAFAAGLETQLRLGEDHYDAQIKAEEARKEAERQERARKEMARIAGHQERIGQIKGTLLKAAGAPSYVIAADIDDLAAMDDGPSFEEFADQARLAKAETLARLSEMHAAAVAREAAEAKAKADREELERLRLEQAERDRKERERVAAEQAAEAACLAEQRAQIERDQAAARAEQKRLDDEAAARRAEEDRKAAATRAEEQRVIDEQRAALTQQQEAAAAEAAEARRAAQIAEDRVRNAAQQLLSAATAVLAFLVQDCAEAGLDCEPEKRVLSDAIEAATGVRAVFIAEEDVPF